MKEILSFTLFKIIPVSRSSTHPSPTGFFLWGDEDVSLSEGISFFCGGGDEVSLQAKKFLSKSLPETCIFSNTIMTYLKKLVGTKSLNTKQCPGGLSLRIISHYLPKHLWEILGMRENSTQHPNIYSFLPRGKSSLINLLLPLSKVFFPSSWNSNFHLITQ